MIAKAHNSNEEIKTRILVIAREKFLQFGFTSVTTEEIASDLGISKKTLYTQFQNKEELLREAILGMLDDTELQLKGILLDSSLEFSEKLSKAFVMVRNKLSRIRQPFTRDVARNAPHIWREFQTYRQKKILRQFRQLFASGINNGLIRKEVDFDLMVLIFEKLADSVMNPEIVSEIPYSVDQVFDQTMNVFFKGILTDKARAEVPGKSFHRPNKEKQK